MAKKYKVPFLTKFVDDLLKLIPTTWDKNESKWNVTLIVSKWLGLNETRFAVLKYLCKIENLENFKKYKKLLHKEDFRDFQKMLNDSNNDKESKCECEGEDENETGENNEINENASEDEG